MCAGRLKERFLRTEELRAVEFHQGFSGFHLLTGVVDEKPIHASGKPGGRDRNAGFINHDSTGEAELRVCRLPDHRNRLQLHQCNRTVA